eukprot:5211714-Ditylum_brightwellii.AAC.1
MIPWKSTCHMSNRASFTLTSSKTAKPCSSPSHRPGSVPEQKRGMAIRKSAVGTHFSTSTTKQARRVTI